MTNLFGLSRYLVLIAVIFLLLAALAVFIFGGITTVNIIIEAFASGEFSAEGARLISLELIEMIDLFLQFPKLSRATFSYRENTGDGRLNVVTDVGPLPAKVPDRKPLSIRRLPSTHGAVQEHGRDDVMAARARAFASSPFSAAHFSHR